MAGVDFTCNICGAENVGVTPDAMARDAVSCRRCGSSVRLRSVVHLLSLALFGRSLALPAWSVRRDLRGGGLSDWEGYANRLSEKLDYTNTFFHTAPFLDICDPAPGYRGAWDFLISSDVFEHVPPPAQRAFDGAHAVLRPGGHLILTVPFLNEPQTREHYPSLHDFAVVPHKGSWLLVNKTVEGQFEVFDDLVFHGGPGQTVEMRVFCRDAIVRSLEAAGFRDIRVLEEDHPEFGVLLGPPFSRPIHARA